MNESIRQTLTFFVRAIWIHGFSIVLMSQPSSRRLTLFPTGVVNPPDQERLKRQPQPKEPARDLPVADVHPVDRTVNIRREDRDQEDDQPECRELSALREKDANAAGDFHRSANVNQRDRPGKKRRHERQIWARRNEMTGTRGHEEERD